MKLSIILILIIIVFQNCKDNDDKKVKSRFVSFEIKNESNMNATIYLFRRNNDLFKEIIIDSGDSSIIDEGYETLPYTPTYSITVSIDSAIILFSDNKKLIQTIENRGYNDMINNILGRSYYSEINDKFRFNLRQSDYLRAK